MYIICMTGVLVVYHMHDWCDGRKSIWHWISIVPTCRKVSWTGIEGRSYDYPGMSCRYIVCVHHMRRNRGGGGGRRSYSLQTSKVEEAEVCNYLICFQCF